MDPHLLKASVRGALDALVFPPGPEFEFNQKYAGARFDEAALKAGWREVARDESRGDHWLELLYDLPDGRMAEFRVCASLTGFWRDVSVTLFDPAAEPRRVRTSLHAVPPWVAKEIADDFDAAMVEEAPGSIREEIARILGLAESEDPPPDAAEDERRLTAWTGMLADHMEHPGPIARRLVSGAVRHGNFCSSGEVLADAAFAAALSGMRTEARLLLGHALDEEAQNTANYWNLLGCTADSLGLRREAFDCFAAARAAAPERTDLRESVWIIGGRLMPALLHRLDFAGIVHCAQVMLDGAAGVSPLGKALTHCALALGYEGKGDLDEAATYFRIAAETFEEQTRDAKTSPDTGGRAAPGFCAMAVAGLHRLEDPSPERRQSAFEAQVASFPKTPAEAGWLGAAPVTFVGERPHGDHWRTVVGDARTMDFHAMLQAGSVEGDQRYDPSEVAFEGYREAQCIEFPHASVDTHGSIRVFMLGGVKEDGRATLGSAFPVFGAGGFADLVVHRVHEHPSGLEAEVSATLPGGGTLVCFVPDYYSDRGHIKEGFLYRVELAGFAYVMEPCEQQGLSSLTPQMQGPGDANHTFVGTVEEVSSYSFLGNRGYRVVVDPYPGDPADLKLPIFIGEHRLEGFVPQVGTVVSGVLWLQGILRAEIGPAPSPDAAAGLSSPPPLPEWVKDDDDADDSLNWIVDRALARLHPESVEGLPRRVAGDPQMVLRAGGRNLFLHLLAADVESQGQLEELLEDSKRLYDRFAEVRRVTVQHVGIGRVRQGAGWLLVYAGFEELAGRFGRPS